MSLQGLILIAFNVGLAIAGSVPSGACLSGAPTHECQQQASSDEAQLKNLKNIAQLTTTEDISALFQGQNAQVLTARMPRKGDPKMVADQMEASMRPRMQKLMEINTSVQDIKELIGAGTTPEVAGLIQKLIDILTDDLQEKIKQEQTNAQTEVDTQIDALTKKTESAVGEKAVADRLDKSHDQCVTEEKRMLEAYETCKEEEALLTTELPSEAYCGSPDFHISYSDPPQLPAKLVIDWTQGLEYVHLQLDVYLKPVKDWIELQKVEAVDDQAKWDEADRKCKAKTTELADKTEECSLHKLVSWRTQNEKCLNAKNQQKVSLCEFGHAYENKCAVKIAFDILKADIDGSGTVWSEEDRENEWTQTNKLTCTLMKFKTTTDLTTGAVAECTKLPAKAAAQFTQDVTRIDTKQETYAALTSEESFTCAETGLKFGDGILWTVPMNSAGEVGWVPKSASYSKATDHTYATEHFCSEATTTPALTTPAQFSCTAGAYQSGANQLGSDSTIDYSTCLSRCNDVECTSFDLCSSDGCWLSSTRVGGPGGGTLSTSGNCQYCERNEE